jgi:hypothetical protein
MTNKNGLSKTILNLLRYGDSIYDAVFFWSGEETRLRKTPELDYVNKWLKDNGMSIYEFLIYLTHYSVQETEDDVRKLHRAGQAYKQNSSMYLLRTPNAWQKNEKLMLTFYEWKVRRTLELEMKYKVIKEDFRSYVDLYGEDMIYNVLHRDFLRAGPVFTLDLAMCNHSATDMNIPKLAKQCMPLAEMMLMGCPEYLKICHYLAIGLEENKHGITTAIFSGD